MMIDLPNYLTDRVSELCCITVAVLLLAGPVESNAFYFEAAQPTIEPKTSAAATFEYSIATSYPTQQTIWLDETTKQSALIEFTSDHDKTYGNVLLLLPINQLPTRHPGLSEFIHQLNNYGWNVYGLVLAPEKFSIDNFSENQKVTFEAAQAIKQKNQLPLFNVLFDTAADLFLSGLANNPEAQQTGFSGMIFLWPRFISNNKARIEQPVKFSIPMYVFIDPLSDPSGQATVKLLKGNNAKVVRSLNYPKPGVDRHAFEFIARRLHGWQKQITRQ